jgi:ABC-type bacteriocin/lantibiotic exporter with double-glycine peptidase domain
MTAPAAPKPPRSDNRVHAAHFRLGEAFALDTERRARGGFAPCLRALLKELGWVGDRRRILEVLPYQQPIDSMETMRAVLHRLGYATTMERGRLAHLPNTAFPALLEMDSRLFVALRRVGAEQLAIYDPETDQERVIMPTAARVRRLQVQIAEEGAEDRSSWMMAAFMQLRRPIVAVFAISLCVNMVALATPIFTSAVYDLVIRARAVDTLAWLTVAAALALAFEYMLRRERGAMVAKFGARFDAALTAALFQKLMSFPLRMTESAPVAAQIMRLRDFEKIRAIFQGNLMNALLDLPFAILFAAAIFIYGGVLGFIPVALALSYGLIWFASRHFTHAQAMRSGVSGAALQSFLMEAVGKRGSIRSLNLTGAWRLRTQRLAREAADRRFHAQNVENVLHTIAQSLATLAGAAALGVGALMVMDNQLSMGALIATMIFIWRVITPIQTAFLSSQRLAQFAVSVASLNRLMAMPSESRRASTSAPPRRFTGELSLETVSFRYGPEYEPALRGVSLKIAPGEMVAISGPTGAGKSTLLKIMLGLMEPQGGAVLADGLNMKSLDPGVFRAQAAYAPQKPILFHGTLLQNLRLVAPTASEAGLKQALRAAGLELTDPPFPDGLQTWLKAGGLDLNESTRAKLMLAALYAKGSPLYLLDDPGAYLDVAGDRAFVSMLAHLRGKASIVLVTNRPSHMRLADRIVVLEQGQLIADGPSDKVLAALEKAGKAGYQNIRGNAA